MDQTTQQLAAALTHRLRLLRGTQESFTTDLGAVFYQAASYQGDAVLIEITGDEFLPDDRRLTAAQHEQLLRLGFTRPDDAMPNWWIGIEDGRDRGLLAAARAVITALVEVHGVSPHDLTADLPLFRYLADPPRPLPPQPAPSREEKALLPLRITAVLTHRFRKLRGTQTMFTVDLGGVFYQAASCQGDTVLVEITGDEFLPDDRRLTTAQHEHLLRLGFNRPNDTMPNWWLRIEDGRDRDLFAAAHAVITALIEVHGVSTDTLTTELTLYRYSPYPPRTLEPRPDPTQAEGEPLGVQTTYGDVLLYPNGHATLNGAPWAERPVREWIRLDDGRLSVTMAIPADDYFPNVGFVADTEANVNVLRGFLPSRADQTNLAHRLALAEHYALTCIATGTMYHERLFRASLALEQAKDAVKASDVVGWRHAARLDAAHSVISAFYFSHSADNARELHGDQRHVWEAIQTWVRLSPWKDDFDFDIIPSEPHPFAIAGPEVEIQRLY